MSRLSRQLCAAVTANLSGRKVPPPEAGILLWNAFQRLSSARTYHMAGPNPLQPSEIEAFCSTMRLPLEPRHVAILMEMDRVWMDHALSALSRSTDRKARAAVSCQPITGAIFDAMFG